MYGRLYIYIYIILLAYIYILYCINIFKKKRTVSRKQNQTCQAKEKILVQVVF